MSRQNTTVCTKHNILFENNDLVCVKLSRFQTHYPSSNNTVCQYIIVTVSLSIYALNMSRRRYTLSRATMSPTKWLMRYFKLAELFLNTVLASAVICRSGTVTRLSVSRVHLVRRLQLIINYTGTYHWAHEPSHFCFWHWTDYIDTVLNQQFGHSWSTKMTL